MRRRLWAMIGVLALPVLPGCSGDGPAWLTKEPFAGTGGKIVPGGPLPTKPVPPPRDFAEHRTIDGPGQRLAMQKSPEVPLGLPDEDEPATAEADPPSPSVAALPPLAPPRPREEPLLAAMKAYSEGKPAEAAEALKGLDRPSREMVLDLIPVLARVSAAGVNRLDPTEAGILSAQLSDASAAVARRAPLSIDKTAFCWSAISFGRYEPIPKGTPFKPGEIYILYVELGNVPCLPAVERGVEGYLTRLNCTLQLREAGSGKVLEVTGKGRQPTAELVQEANDFSRSPLKDYFLRFWFTAPQKPGRYVVNVKVRDPATNREVSRSEPFQVGP